MNQYIYLPEEDINFIRYLTETYPKNYVRILKSKHFKNKHPGLWNRIQQEFSTLIGIDENTTIPTKIYMLIHGMKELPKCPVCNKYLRNNVNIFTGFLRFCSNKCATKSEETKNKRAKTNEIKYGGNCPAKNKAVVEKARQTNRRKRGVDWPSQDPEVYKKQEETAMRNHGVKNGGASKQAWEKIKETKRKNGNISKAELKYYELLVKQYGKENVLMEYKSEEYPFYCDFYIITEKLYIEIQGHWTHGKHPFDPNNPEDIKLLEKWKIRSNGNPKSHYSKAIFIWTIKDVEKRETAKRNNLNYLEIWPK